MLRPLFYCKKVDKRMREIKAEAVTAAVRQLCITANKVLPEDLVQCIGCARRTEPNSTAKSILGDL